MAEASKKFLGMNGLVKFFLLLRDYITGETAYQNYLKHCGQTKPLDKRTFLRNREKSKWEKVRRCC
ncbi:MAG: YbdD/YjiX family protein [Alphaproteobacteria bacterium]|nr:YbdD/YjiX family protein [Alphaproteobacteria bacterium]